MIAHLGDCLAYMRTLPDNSMDSMVVDPPYGLSAPPDISVVLQAWLAGDKYEHGGAGFMGAKWDSFVPGPRVWREALRVLKPGGHLIAFAGTRTVDLMGISLRLAGWEIRDTLHWCYWSGFPKSRDVSKDMDAMVGAERMVVGLAHQDGVESPRLGYGGAADKPVYRTAPATPDAIQWDGWGTAVKPTIEPAILCRKPISESSIARNVLRWGTGALNIDACRFKSGDPMWPGPQEVSDTRRPGNQFRGLLYGDGVEGVGGGHDLGRFPANLLYCPKAPRAERELGCGDLPMHAGHEAVHREEGSAGVDNPRAGAGRTAKAVRNHHPTVKPVRLMRYLVRLVTPPAGTVLDPFMGSGTCGIAAKLEGYHYIGAEIAPEFYAIAMARMSHAAFYPSSWAHTEPGSELKPDNENELLEKAGQTRMFG